MPTIRVARPVVRAAVSFDAPTAAVAASPPTEPSIDTLLEDATLKVCVECIEEGYDNFCAKCGGRMVPLGDDEPDVAESMDELESLSLSAQDLLVCNEGLARLEALLKPDEPPPQPQPSPRVEEVRKPSKPVPGGRWWWSAMRVMLNLGRSDSCDACTAISVCSSHVPSCRHSPHPCANGQVACGCVGVCSCCFRRSQQQRCSAFQGGFEKVLCVCYRSHHPLFVACSQTRSSFHH